jgi:LacI family transcriptional regulator
MGVQSFNLLLEEINTRKDLKEFTPRTLELETQIIERESSK